MYDFFVICFIYLPLFIIIVFVRHELMDAAIQLVVDLLLNLA